MATKVVLLCFLMAVLTLVTVQGFPEDKDNVPTSYVRNSSPSRGFLQAIIEPTEQKCGYCPLPGCGNLICCTSHCCSNDQYCWCCNGKSD